MRKLLPLLMSACAAVPNLATSESRIAIDPDRPWDRHVIVAPTAALKGADGVALGDVDLDGRLDVVTPWEQGRASTIALGPPDPTLAWEVISLPTLGAPEGAAIGDVDLDGCPDVAVSTEAGPAWVAFQSCQDRIPAPRAPWALVNATLGGTPSRWLTVTIADLDEDGLPDLLVGGKHDATHRGRIAVLSSATPRSPGSWTEREIAPVGWAMTAHPTDLDGDGDLDVLASDRKGAGLASSMKGSWWHERRADGSWSPTRIAHVTGDAGMLGRAEVGGAVAAIVDGSRTALWLRRPSPMGGWISAAVPFPPGTGDYHASAVADLDADGQLDIVTTHALTNASGVVWLRGPTWERREISGEIGHKYDDAALADLDGDGDLDVITSEGGDLDKTDDLGVVWFENPAVRAN